ncbi:hypothetical protein N7535_005317 [Penicillium sp. DV-2018c]|nr:hypothetical protein N7461_008898 [Penicillium sp. DV-2018c]KAJ5571657.1 hypothetical protein N7535_005317 [Penicillium sp. DV-2018c]
MADSPAQSVAGGDSNPSAQIHFKFCRECSNLLYPKEDRVNNQLLYTCRTCHVSEPASSHCVYQNNLHSQVGDTAGVTQDVTSDPTVRVPGFCVLCGDIITCYICDTTLPNDASDDGSDKVSEAASEEIPETHGVDALPAIAIPEAQAASKSSTLPRANKLCPSCGENEAVFFQSQQRSAETGMKLYYVCCACGHVYT